MRRLIRLLLLGLVVCQLGAPVAHAQNERLVLAFYYAWFDQATWQSGQLPDQPTQPSAAYRAGAVIAPTVAPAASPTATENRKGLADPSGFQSMPTPSASPTPMPTATATPTTTASPTCTATSTSTPTPTATASATATASPTLQPSPSPTDTPAPSETPTIQPQSGLDGVPLGVWVIAGGVALLIGMALGGVWSSRRAVR